MEHYYLFLHYFIGYGWNCSNKDNSENSVNIKINSDFTIKKITNKKFFCDYYIHFLRYLFNLIIFIFISWEFVYVLYKVLYYQKLNYLYEIIYPFIMGITIFFWNFIF